MFRQICFLPSKADHHAVTEAPHSSTGSRLDVLLVRTHRHTAAAEKGQACAQALNRRFHLTNF
jgi:hypothetical protein